MQHYAEKKMVGCGERGAHEEVIKKTNLLVYVHKMQKAFNSVSMCRARCVFQFLFFFILFSVLNR